jgi:transcriptional regulator with XRE-family HTH domain
MIGKRITALRTAKGLTQQAVATGISISRATYAHYEIDRREPDNKTLIKIANFFDVSTDYLLGVTDLPKPYVLDKNSALYKLALEAVTKQGFTPADIQEENPAIAEFMQEHKIIKAKAKMDIVEKSGLSLETLEKLVALVQQIKKDTTEN